MILRDDLVRLRSDPTVVGVVERVVGNVVWIDWLFGSVPQAQFTKDVEVVGRYSGVQ